MQQQIHSNTSRSCIVRPTAAREQHCTNGERQMSRPAAAFEDGMQTLIVMDHTGGDRRHHFDPTDCVEVLDATRRFRKLSKAGYTGANRTGNGTSDVIRQFDPTVEETPFIPRLVVGR
jgi:hypothetical protein